MVLIASVVLLIVAWFLINRTRLGLAWRATEQDFKTASAFGVNIDRAVASNFFLGSAVAGAAGVLVDEGSTGLMPIFVDNVFDALSELNRRGVSILLVEQNAKRWLVPSFFYAAIHRL